MFVKRGFAQEFLIAHNGALPLYLRAVSTSRVPTMSTHIEIAIIGAGPAGISAATNAVVRNRSHILFEKGEIANTIYDYQLHKHVMAEPGRLPLRAHARFEAGSREKVLAEYAEDLARHKVNLVRKEVLSIERTGDGFRITFSGGECTASYVILATGVQGTPRKLGVPGEDQPHIGYTLRDAAEFSQKHIIVVGAGDAAIENALALCETNTVSLVNRGGEFARAKDANVKLILSAIEKKKVRCLYNASLSQIEAKTTVVNTPEGEVSLAADHIIARLGCVTPRPFLEKMGVSFPNSDPNAVPVVNERYESNVPGLFILGALIGYPLIKQAMNQGHEVIEHICGNPIQPADQELLEERFANIRGGFEAHYEKIRANVPLFAGLSAPQMREMVIDATLHVVDRGAVIFGKNDYTDTFWSIIEGSVDIEMSEGRSITLEQGNFFGEMGLISGRRRTATARAGARGAFLIETPRKQMLKLLASVTSVRRTLDETFMLRALQTSIFPEVDPAFLQSLVTKATPKNFRKGEILFKEGEIGDALYVIRKGSVKISRKHRSGADVTQTYIAAGNFVGEMALMSREDLPRSATVSAAVGCETIIIKKTDFLELLEQFPAVQQRLAQKVEERRVENMTTDWNQQSGSLLDFMMREGLSDAENVMLIDSDLCIGCDNCEAACAATHGGYSRLDRKGGKSFASIQVPLSCRHCENPLCMTDCPPDALVRLASGEVMIRDSCIGCGNCVGNCPYGVIKLVYEKGTTTGFSLRSLLGLAPKEKGPAKAAKCDMCHSLAGGPACVRACPTGAAMRVNSVKLVQIAQSKHV